MSDGTADPVQFQQQHDAPAFDQQLMGKRLEVLWKYFDKDTKEPHLIWATGRVGRVADGVTTLKSRRCTSILPAGALLWQWDADPVFEEAAGEQWLVLLPKKSGTSSSTIAGALIHANWALWRAVHRLLGVRTCSERVWMRVLRLGSEHTCVISDLLIS